MPFLYFPRSGSFANNNWCNRNYYIFEVGDGTKIPILRVELFRNNVVFVFSNLAALINYSATFAVSFLLSLYLQYIKGFTQKRRVSLDCAAVMMAIFSPIAGILSDRIEPLIVASIGMALTTIGWSCSFSLAMLRL